MKLAIQKFASEYQAMKYANKTYKNYGFDASVFKMSKKGEKTKWATLDPKKAGMKKVPGWQKYAK
jgi:hypothetical protein